MLCNKAGLKQKLQLDTPMCSWCVPLQLPSPCYDTVHNPRVLHMQCVTCILPHLGLQVTPGNIPEKCIPCLRSVCQAASSTWNLELGFLGAAQNCSGVHLANLGWMWCKFCYSASFQINKLHVSTTCSLFATMSPSDSALKGVCCSPVVLHMIVIRSRGI